jgi:predicted transposase YdaD
MASETPGKARTRYDWYIKAVLRRFGADLAAWLVGERPLSAATLGTALPAVTLVDADRILDIRFEGRPSALLHIEFQMEDDPEMPGRMAEYLIEILRLLKSFEHTGKRLASAVLYLDPREYRCEDPGFLDVEGDLGTRIFISYKVVKLWEVDPRPILAMQSPGLCPFVPLMRGNPAELVVESKDKILQTPEETAPLDSKKELLTVLGIMATRALRDRELVKKLLSEIRTMGENYFIDLLLEEGMEKGLEKGLVKGRREEALRILQQFLELRFGEPGRDVGPRLQAIDTIDEIESLFEEAVITRDLQTFLDRLPTPSHREP